MRSWRRIFYFILLNILISALTTWGVVTYILRNTTVPDETPAEPTLVSRSDEPAGDQLVTEPAAADVIEEGGSEVVPEILEIDSVIGNGVLQTERVLIEHIGEKEISLSGWQLQDQDGNVFTFPALTMFRGGAVTVYTRAGTSTVVELYWGLEEPIWQSGERAFLLDPDGTVQAVYEVP